jgi:hypothetical protein
MDSKARPSGDSTPTEQLEKITDQPTDNRLNRAVSPAEFDRILRKIDIRVIPILAIFYLLSFLDRGLYHDLPSYSHVLTSCLGSIGNANIQGLSETLGLVGQQYNW